MCFSYLFDFNLGVRIKLEKYKLMNFHFFVAKIIQVKHMNTSGYSLQNEKLTFNRINWQLCTIFADKIY